jgi:hypothetical protein
MLEKLKKLTCLVLFQWICSWGSSLAHAEILTGGCELSLVGKRQ